MKKLVWAILGFLMLATAQAASFDCNRASTRIEKMICNSACISALDSKLHDEYEKALAQACDAADLQKSQRQWLKLRDKSKDDQALSFMYEQQLEWFHSKASPPHIEYLVINPRLGKYKLEIAQGKCTEYRINPHQEYTVTIFNSAGERLQQIAIQSSYSPDEILSVKDIDGDGYQDLLFQLGVGHGPFPFNSLYRYHVETNQFKHDESFPFEGEVTPSEHKGCVHVEERESTGDANYEYEQTEWCLSTDTGEWSEAP